MYVDPPAAVYEAVIVLVYRGVDGHALLNEGLQTPPALEFPVLTKIPVRPVDRVETAEFVALFTVTIPLLLLKIRTCQPMGTVVASGSVTM